MPDNFISDHVPILTSIPLNNASEDKSDVQPKIKFISWNVNQNWIPPTAPGASPYSEDQIGKRHRYIAESLRQMVKVQQPHFITLQNIMGSGHGNNSNLFYSILNELEDYNYAAVPGIGRIDKDEDPQIDKVIGKHNCITLYNSNIFKALLLPEDVHKEEIDYLRGNQFAFSLKENKNFKITVGNIFTPTPIPEYNNHPAESEKAITDYLKTALTNVIVAIGTNDCNAFTTNKKRQNISTFSTCDENQSARGAVDNMFYLFQDERKYHQAKVRQLDPLTGEIVLHDEFSPLNIDTLSDEQKNNLNKLHMGMCIDHSLHELMLPDDNKDNIFTYEATLRHEFKNDNITVRLANNVNNEKGLAIEVPPNLYNYLKLVNDPKLEFSEQRNTFTRKNFYVVAAPALEIPKLRRLIQKAITNPDLLDFAKNILSLERSNIRADIKDNFKLLFRSFLDKDTDVANESHRIIIKHFSTEAVAFAKNTNRSLEDFQKTCDNLDRKLYGKKPMSPAVKGFIFGLIGAIVGFFVGAIIAGLATAPTGGWGAFVGAAVGAVKGFGYATTYYAASTAAIGSGITAGSTIIVGGSAASIGVFGARKNLTKYEQAKNKKNETLSTDVLTNVAKMRPFLLK